MISEPLTIPQLTINNENGNFRLNGKYKNVVVRGGSGIYITDVKSDLKVRLRKKKLIFQCKKSTKSILELQNRR